jgi:hypothetical protein
LVGWRGSSAGGIFMIAFQAQMKHADAGSKGKRLKPEA